MLLDFDDSDIKMTIRIDDELAHDWPVTITTNKRKEYKEWGKMNGQLDFNSLTESFMFN